MIEELWILGSIIFINIILSADNSLVISLSANRLPLDLRKRAIVWGSIIAVCLRFLLLLVGTYLIQIPFVKFIASLLLLWVAVQLGMGQVKEERNENSQKEEDQKLSHRGKHTVLQAVRVIAVADFVMSLDNAIGMLGVADGHYVLMMIGLIITIPLLVFGSTFLARLLDAYPWITVAAITILGWTAGNMMMDDVIFKNIIYLDVLSWTIPAVTSLSILMFGIWGIRRQQIAQTRQTISS